ncbi:MAG: GNAT family N-acetyltransferase [Chloroflexota bacterium]
MAEQLVALIREATPGDLPAMEWEGEYRRYRRLYRQAMAEANAGRYRILLAEADRQVVGQVLVRLGVAPPQLGDPADAGYLHALRVRPAYRNQGLGSRLISEAETLLRRQGYRRVALAVAKDNTAARRLYERLGYNVVADDPGGWSYLDDEGRLRHVREPAHILQKTL